MKNISTILSIVAIIAAGALFYLHFSQEKNIQKTSDKAAKNEPAAVRIAYFDIDSLQANYNYFKDASSQAKAKENSINAELKDMMNRFQARIQELQAKGNTMSQKEAEDAQHEYKLMDQRYGEKKMVLENELQKEQYELMTAVRKSIETYLKDYNKTKGYSFILAYEPGTMMYYKDSLYDITSELLRGLNDQYTIKKKKP